MYSILLWVVVGIFVFLPKTLTVKQNTFIFLFISIVMINFNLVMNFSFNFLKDTSDPVLFVTLLIYRDIIVPFIFLIFMNLYKSGKGRVGKVFVFTTFLLGLFYINQVGEVFQLYEYKRWNRLLDFGFLLGLLLLSIGVSNLFQALCKKEEAH